ncbi:MAG: pyridoxamine 5'-phosphate oxidase family protein [Dehalococcoidia bacterium]|nr:pyridoxamine 5'-phosphate oxidase family protein [Dehalococcoidia bacterium]
MDKLRILFASQQLAVLATQSEGQPYCNLVAFAGTDDLKYLVFVTNRDTRKYANIERDGNVALLIDNRTNRPSDLKTGIAVTALGLAGEALGDERARLAAVYSAKHPNLTDFLNSPGQALIKVTTTCYVVASFDSTQTILIGD